MDKLKKLDMKIRLLRKKLEYLLLSLEMKDNKILQLSKRLDKLINQYYSCKNKN